LIARQKKKRGKQKKKEVGSYKAKGGKKVHPWVQVGTKEAFAFKEETKRGREYRGGKKRRERVISHLHFVRFHRGD